MLGVIHSLKKLHCEHLELLGDGGKSPLATVSFAAFLSATGCTCSASKMPPDVLELEAHKTL